MSADRFAALRAHAARLDSADLATLIGDRGRSARLRRRSGPLLLDLSRQRLDGPALDALGARLESLDWTAARDAMFAGAVVNCSERRAALHTALRAHHAALPALAPQAQLDEVAATRARMATIVEALRAGQGAAVGLADGITDVVNLGIGGSDLGPRLAVQALAADDGPLRIHFLPNVDGAATAALMRRLDPRRTLVLLVSKSFNTQETLLNGGVLRDWIAAAVGADRAVRQLLAVTANVPAAQRFGVPPAQVLPMWDWVGGRYSVWSAVGLSLALAIGMPGFEAFLSGAAGMDDHFRSTPWPDNLPVLLALAEVWNRNLRGHASRAVVPYADALELLPGYLQQLEMESLGKRVDVHGTELAHETVPVVWGSVGTNAQHAYFQALHQGTTTVPVEFVGVVRPAHALAANHAALLANLLAQAAALALGKSRAQALAESSAGRDDAAALAAQRTFTGNRPSTVLLLDELTPASLGALLALYEHKTFVQALLWGINPFDQWGVELGKTIATAILPTLTANAADETLDASTQALIAEIRARRALR